MQILGNNAHVLTGFCSCSWPADSESKHIEPDCVLKKDGAKAKLQLSESDKSRNLKKRSVLSQTKVLALKKL